MVYYCQIWSQEFGMLYKCQIDLGWSNCSIMEQLLQLHALNMEHVLDIFMQQTIATAYVNRPLHYFLNFVQRQVCGEFSLYCCMIANNFRRSGVKLNIHSKAIISILLVSCPHVLQEQRQQEMIIDYLWCQWTNAKCVYIRQNSILFECISLSL